MNNPVSAAGTRRRLSAVALAAQCGIGLLLGFGLAWLGRHYAVQSSAPRLAVVDLTAIVRNRQQASATMLADATMRPEARETALLSIRQFGHRLDHEVAELGKECHCVLLVREAVVAGQVDDLTPTLLRRLEDKQGSTP